MGRVYLARCEGACFDRNVAIKVLRAGMADARFLARFRGERRILAQLDPQGACWESRAPQGGETRQLGGNRVFATEPAPDKTVPERVSWALCRKSV